MKLAWNRINKCYRSIVYFSFLSIKVFN